MKQMRLADFNEDDQEEDKQVTLDKKVRELKD